MEPLRIGRLGAFISVLESHGFRGWYTKVQDAIRTGVPEGEGPQRMFGPASSTCAVPIAGAMDALLLAK